MARTIKQIQDALTAAKDADPVMSVELTSASKVAVWKLWTYIVAFCQSVLEFLFDKHKAENDTNLANQRAHKLQWYVLKAKYFQYGHVLIDETDTFAEIDEAAQIVAEAAAVEVNNRIWLKLATDTGGGVLGAIPEDQLAVIKVYFDIVKDAGVRIDITSTAADDLQLQLEIYFNPLVLLADGSRIDGTNPAPVKDAINTFLKTIPFNGVFVLNRLIDAIRAVEGVFDCLCPLAQARYAALPYEVFTLEYAPNSGHLLIDETFLDSNIAYIPH